MLNDLGYYLNTQPFFVTFVVWAMVIFTGIIIALLFYITYLRLRLRAAQWNANKVKETWRPVFKSLKGRSSIDLPHLSARHRPYLLELWVEEEQLAQDDYRKSLVSLAFQIGLDHEISRILKVHDLTLAPRKIWLQSIAITASRWIDTEETRESLLVMAESDNYYLASRACTSLVAVRADGWEREIISTLFRFPKHAPFIAVQLSEVGGAEVLRVLEPFINLLPTYTEMNFVSLVERVDDKSLLPLLLVRLRESDAEEEKAAVLRALRRIGGDENRADVIPYLSHPTGFLRLQAIKTLSRLGRHEDRELLVPHLSDPDWWIRYRSAQAYIRLTGNNRADIPEFIASLTDRYSRDILHHALAEVDWCMV